MVMHLAALCNLPLVAIMGNALPETFGPRPQTDNQIILSRNPDCSPCSRKTCHKINGNSCVQDISSEEILQSLRLLK